MNSNKNVSCNINIKIRIPCRMKNNLVFKLNTQMSRMTFYEYQHERWLCYGCYFCYQPFAFYVSITLIVILICIAVGMNMP